MNPFHNFQLSTNAEKAYFSYMDKIKDSVSSEEFDLENFERFIQEKIYLQLKEASDGGEIDAEMMMDAIYGLSNLETLIGEYRNISSPMVSIQNTNQMYRSKNDRVFAGVCGGIAEYFNVDSAIIRSLYLLLSFTIGITIFAYPILWIVLPLSAGKPHRPTPKSIVNFIPDRKTGKLVHMLLFFLLAIILYIPMTFGLLASAIYCICGFFYPIIHIREFTFSFSSFGGGQVLAVSVIAFNLGILALLIAFVLRIHLKMKMMSKSTVFFLIFTIIASIFTSVFAIAIIMFEHQEEYKKIFVRPRHSYKEYRKRGNCVLVERLFKN